MLVSLRISACDFPRISFCRSLEGEIEIQTPSCDCVSSTRRLAVFRANPYCIREAVNWIPSSFGERYGVFKKLEFVVVLDKNFV